MSVHQLLVALVLSASSLAQAETLRLSSDRPVVFIVNAVPRPVTPGNPVVVHTRDFGGQNLHIVNLLGNRVWSGRVDIPKGGNVRVRWSHGRMDIAKQAPAGRASSNRAPASTEASRPARPSPQANTPSTSWVPQDDSQLQDPGYLDALAAAVREAEALSEAERAPAPAPTPPPAGGQGSVHITPRTTSWMDLWLDGTLAHSFRKQGDGFRLDLASGAHAVEVHDPFSNDVWFSGELWIYDGFELQLEVGKSAPPAALNRPEAWRQPE